MRPTTRRTLEGSMRRRLPATRDLRRRQLPAVPSHAVPTRECQSDPPSLSRTVRCSRPRGQPLDRASPLDLLLHVRQKTRINEDRLADLLPRIRVGDGRREDIPERATVLLNPPYGTVRARTS